MRKAALLCLVILLLPMNDLVQAQTGQPNNSLQKGLFTQTNVEKAWKNAAAQQKPMLVMFTSERCKFCQKMLAETYGHPAIQQILAGRTETVLAHAEDYRDLTKKLGIRGYPTSLLVSPKGDVLDFMEGYVAPKAFAQRVYPHLAGDNSRALAAATTTPRQTTGR
ncbi:MAG: thioredoxin family protein [Pirellulales bacterium]|nr:thioredoxin family protein [Pirellulales bacterium]